MRLLGLFECGEDKRLAEHQGQLLRYGLPMPYILGIYETLTFVNCQFYAPSMDFKIVLHWWRAFLDFRPD